jgi:hypothetical protein
MAMTENEFITALRAACALVHEMAINVGSQRTDLNIIALTDAVIAAAKGSQGPLISSSAKNYRNDFTRHVRTSEGRKLVDPVLIGFMQDVLQIDRSRVANIVENWDLIYRYFAEKSPTPDTFKSRQIAFDTSATESGVGDGDVYRLTVDKYGYPMESAPAPMDWTLECVADAGESGVSLGEEIFNIFGPSSSDLLDFISGQTSLAGGSLQPLNSDLILSNHSDFGNTQATAAPTGLGSWLIESGDSFSNYEIVDTGFAESTEENASRWGKLALKVKAAATGKSISQVIDGIDPDAPLFNSLRVYPNASETVATVTVDLGSHSVTWDQDLGQLTPGAWNTLVLPSAKELYPDNFSQGAGTTYKISYTLDHDLLIDNVRLRPWQFYGGSRWVIDSGATAFRANLTNRKVFQFGDTATNNAVIQLALVFLYGRYLSAAASPTIADSV